MLTLTQAMEAKQTGNSVIVLATGELARVVDYLPRRFNVPGSNSVLISVGSGVGTARVEWVRRATLSQDLLAR